MSPRPYPLLVGLFMFIFLAPGWLSGQNTLKGTVIFPDEVRPFMARHSGYDKEVQTDSRVSGTHVVLYPLSFRPPTAPIQDAVITQKGERFIPQVLLITPGTTVYFLNEDNQYHNVFSRTMRATFNIGRRPPGHMYPQQINRTGLIKVFCDIHAHMRAYLLSVETPYFTRVNGGGGFQLAGLPDGTYRVEVVHPRFPTHTQEITLSGGGVQSLNPRLRQ